MQKIKLHHFYKRLAIFCLGICIMAFGVVFSIKADLGTAPISTVPYVSALITNTSVGMTTIILNVLIVFFEILILRNKFQKFQLLQIPVTVAFGVLIDFATFIMQNINYTNYLEQWLLCLTGMLLLATGISLEIYANLVPMPGEGIVLAICQVLPIQFGNMKVILDVSFVTTATVLSLVCLDSLTGVREGTIASALLVGNIIKFINKILFP